MQATAEASGRLLLDRSRSPVTNPLLALITPLRRGKRVHFPIPSHDQAMIEYLAGLLGSGAFKPVIDRQYSLDEIVEAYRYVETGNKVGNVVVTPG
jgi:NADPH:quinone reductase-like Zn-dependent oxidoreductase